MARASRPRTTTQRASLSLTSRKRALANADANFPVVAIGASAGGLEAFRALLAALPVRTGMAFILVQHLDPTHASMLADLLSPHTGMTVLEASQDLPLAPNHVFVIPPGRFLAVTDGALRLSRPGDGQGVRMPFDFLLHSLAASFGERAVCIVLSGTGNDGSAGAKEVKAVGGLVMAQKPEDAEFDGMPRGAIATGAVDLVLPVTQMPKALARYGGHRYVRNVGNEPASPLGDALRQIIDLLREKTSHDFALYKAGTLERRIERRMALAGIEGGGALRRSAEPGRRRTPASRRRSVHQCHAVFSRQEGLRPFGGTKRSRNRTRASTGPADPHLGDGLQHRRGSLFHRHALSGGDRGGAAKPEAANLCHGYRRGRHRVRPRRPVPPRDRTRCDAGAAGTVLHPGRSTLPGVARATRHDRLLGSRCGRRRAVFAP